MRGFFASEVISSPPPSLFPRCGECGLFKKCLSPKMPVAGKGKRGIMILGEAPGKNEDEQGLPFVGKSGQRLQRTLRKLGVDLFEDCWVTNSLRCRPPNNKTPDPNEVDFCRPYLTQAIREHQPHTIIVLGAVAVRSMLGPIWKEDPGTMSQWAGWRIPCHKPNIWICPTFHPSYVERKEKEKGENPVPQMFFERHLEAALELDEVPWPDGPPNYEREVEIVLDTDRAAAILRKMVARGGPVAFDYETDRLKPDHPDSRIVTCAVCWQGKKTIAYPWHGDAITASRELLVSDLPKIGANDKFESRWSHRILGCWPRRWKFDTMVGAHVLDNREGICSLKFQAFVQFGQPPYDTDVKPYLQSDAPNLPNRIRQVDVKRLLKYNALDALLEYKLAEVQMAIFGMSL